MFRTSIYFFKESENIWNYNGSFGWQAIDGHFYMTYSSYAPNESLMQEGTNVSNWRHRYELQCARFNTSTSEYASYIYDSVWTYALALDKLLAGNESLAADFHTEQTTESV